MLTDGGRVLGVTALGDTLADAKRRAYEAVALIQFRDAFYRKDIADKALHEGERFVSVDQASAPKAPYPFSRNRGAAASAPGSDSPPPPGRP